MYGLAPWRGPAALPPPAISRIQPPAPPPSPPKKIGGSLGSLWGGGGGGQVSRVHVVPARSTTINTQGEMGGGGYVLKRLLVGGNMGEGILGGKSQKLSITWLTAPLEVPSVTCCPPFHPSGRGPGHARTLVGIRALILMHNNTRYKMQPAQQRANTHLQIGG